VVRAREMAQPARTTRSSSIARSTTRPGSKPSAVKKTSPSKATARVPAKPGPKVAQKIAPNPAVELRAVKSPASKAPPAMKPSTDIAPAARPSGIVPKGYVPLVDIPPLPPPPKNMKLEVGDKAVHPAHGLGEVIAIEHRQIGSMSGEFYIIRILDNGMRVMVPKASAPAAGLRPVMSGKEAEKVLETMRAREVAVDLQPWSRRFRAYTEMIKSGSPQEVAKVLRDMYRLKFDKDLSFGERRLLDQAKSLLMKELAAAKKMTEAALQAQVDEMFKA
jgi:CarD family transcriptional regulator